MIDERFDEVVRFLTFERHLREAQIARRFFITPRDRGRALKQDAYNRFMQSAHSAPSKAGSAGGLVLIAR